MSRRVDENEMFYSYLMMKSDQQASPLKVTESVHRHDGNESNDGWGDGEMRKKEERRDVSLSLSSMLLIHLCCACGGDNRNEDDVMLGLRQSYDMHKGEHTL
jgi:hypothetical protein